jgi:hypothetical protein
MKLLDKRLQEKNKIAFSCHQFFFFTSASLLEYPENSRLAGCA